MRELLGGFVRKGGSPGRTLNGEGGGLTWLREICTVSTDSDEPPDKPPRRRGEIRAREVMGHGERKISNAPAHGQPSRRRVKQATPCLEGLQVSDTEHVAQLHVEGEAPSLSPPRGVQGLFWKLQPGTMRKQPKEVWVQEVARQFVIDEQHNAAIF